MVRVFNQMLVPLHFADHVFVSMAARSIFISHAKQKLLMQSQECEYAFSEERVESLGESGTENYALVISLAEGA